MNLEERNEAIKKERRKRKVKDVIGNIIFYFWMIIFIVILLFIYIWKQANGFAGISIPLCILVTWLIITFVVLIFKDRKNIFVKKKQLKEMIIEDSKFGKIKFIKDMNDKDNDLKNGNLEISFGKYKPQITIYGYEEGKKELYFRSLDYVYKIQDEIIKNLYDITKDTCDDWEERDSSGNPITYDYIEENFGIEGITIKTEDEDVLITVWGWPGEDGLLGYHSITAEINCKTKEIDYDLVG